MCAVCLSSLAVRLLLGRGRLCAVHRPRVWCIGCVISTLIKAPLQQPFLAKRAPDQAMQLQQAVQRAADFIVNLVVGGGRQDRDGQHHGHQHAAHNAASPRNEHKLCFVLHSVPCNLSSRANTSAYTSVRCVPAYHTNAGTKAGNERRQQLATTAALRSATCTMCYVTCCALWRTPARQHVSMQPHTSTLSIASECSQPAEKARDHAPCLHRC